MIVTYSKYRDKSEETMSPEEEQLNFIVERLVNENIKLGIKVDNEHLLWIKNYVWEKWSKKN